MKDIERIRELIAECRAEARDQGWQGDDEDYVLQAADLDYIVDALGYKPTLEQWRAAGLAWIGSAHYAHDLIVDTFHRQDSASEVREHLRHRGYDAMLWPLDDDYAVSVPEDQWRKAYAEYKHIEGSA